VVEVTASADDQTYHGTALAWTEDNSATAADEGNAILALSAMKTSSNPILELHIAL
jgi:hypothetical protein